MYLHIVIFNEIESIKLRINIFAFAIDHIMMM